VFLKETTIFDIQEIKKIISILIHIDTYMYFNNNYISLIENVEVATHEDYLTFDSYTVHINDILGILICNDYLPSVYNCFSIYIFLRNSQDSIQIFIPYTQEKYFLK